MDIKLICKRYDVDQHLVSLLCEAMENRAFSSQTAIVEILKKINNNDFYEYLVINYPDTELAWFCINLLDENHKISDVLYSKYLGVNDDERRKRVMVKINDPELMKKYLFKKSNGVDLTKYNKAHMVAFVDLYHKSNYNAAFLTETYLKTQSSEIKAYVLSQMDVDSRLNLGNIVVGEKVAHIEPNVSEEDRVVAFNYLIKHQRSTIRMANNVANREWSKIITGTIHADDAKLFLASLPHITDENLINEVFQSNLVDNPHRRALLRNDNLKDNLVIFNTMEIYFPQNPIDLIKLAVNRIHDRKLLQAKLKTGVSEKVAIEIIDALDPLSVKEAKRFALMSSIDTKARVHAVSKINDAEVDVLVDLCLRGVREVFDAAIKKITDEKTLIDLFNARPKTTKGNSWTPEHKFAICRQFADSEFVAKQLASFKWVKERSKNDSRSFTIRLALAMRNSQTIMTMIEKRYDEWDVRNYLDILLDRIYDLNPDDALIDRIRKFGDVAIAKPFSDVWDQLCKLIADDEYLMIKAGLATRLTRSDGRSIIKSIGLGISASARCELLEDLIENGFTDEYYTYPMLENINAEKRVEYILQYESNLTWLNKYALRDLLANMTDTDLQTLAMGP